MRLEKKSLQSSPSMFVEPTDWKKSVSPTRQEDNPTASALLVTVVYEGSFRGHMEHNESKPMLANRVDDLALYGKILNSVELYQF